MIDGDILAYIDATVGGTDGTLVSVDGSQSSPIPIVALYTQVPVSVRCRAGQTSSGVVLASVDAPFVVSGDSVGWGQVAILGIVSTINRGLFVQQLAELLYKSPSLAHLNFMVTVPPEPVTGLTADSWWEQVTLRWAPAVKGTVNILTYHVERRTDGTFIYTDGFDGPLPGVVSVRYGAMSTAAGASTASAGAYGSFSQLDFTDVTYTDVEVTGHYSGGTPSLIARSNNGAQANGSNAYVLVADPVAGLSVYVSLNGVLGGSPICHTNTVPQPGDRVALRCEGTTISIKLDEITVASVVDATYYNGVCGFGSISAGGSWADIAIGYVGIVGVYPESWHVIASTLALALLDLGVIDGCVYQYRVQVEDVVGNSSVYSGIVDGQPFAPQLFTTETVTASLRDLTVDVLPILMSPVDPAETITAALTGLSIVISMFGPEQTPVATQETVTAALQSLSVVLSTILQSANNAPAETITAALTALDIHTHPLELTPIAHTETITAALQSLTITVSPA